MLATIFIIFGVLARVIIHVPNFTPAIAISLLGGVLLPKRWALVLPVILFVLSDLIIGMHDTILFTWGSVIVVAAIGLWVRKFNNFSSVFVASVVSSVVFFLITNFGVWLVSGMYAHTAAGLTECFALAVPFFKTELLSTVVYTAVLYSAYQIAAAKIKQTQLAAVLLD